MMTDSSIEKEIRKTLSYANVPLSRFHVIEMKKIHKSNSDETSHYRSSRTALYIEEDDMIIYPVIHFFKNKGIQKIYIVHCKNNNMIKRIIKEVGSCYVDHNDIVKIGEKLLDKYSLERFYHNIQNIFSMWIKLVTNETPPLIPDYETTTIKKKKNATSDVDDSDESDLGEEQIKDSTRAYYFGIHIDMTKDERNITDLQKEVERKIRKDFSGQIPRFRQDIPPHPCPLV